ERLQEPFGGRVAGVVEDVFVEGHVTLHAVRAQAVRQHDVVDIVARTLDAVVERPQATGCLLVGNVRDPHRLGLLRYVATPPTHVIRAPQHFSVDCRVAGASARTQSSNSASSESSSPRSRLNRFNRSATVIAARSAPDTSKTIWPR